ncbi:MAG: winged helix DNA-binding protein [Dehalococcoidia bacterium]|nr:winged helix DNA-binding protein [Dehalococcoidia bacterium]
MRDWEIELAPSGITLPQALVLYYLQGYLSTPTLPELAQIMCRESYSISALVSRMEADGLVPKKRGPKNSRQTRVLLTKKGQKVIRVNSRWKPRETSFKPSQRKN